MVLVVRTKYIIRKKENVNAKKEQRDFKNDVFYVHPTKSLIEKQDNATVERMNN